ncbi:MFS transporter [Jatrophihabitans sp.]|uniref:MFS transporter n=1 Tax=Jatrophihabitans sp. TaxID=1932789 RepID=UPI002BE8FBD9|nr:MFS transporter [Jatrophihabitans sp.]
MSYAADLRRIRALPGSFWLLWACTFVNRLGTSVLALLTLYLSVGRGLEPAIVGLLIALRGAGTVVSPLLGGWLTDRLGNRATLFLGMASNAVALIAAGLSASVPALVVSITMLGLTDSIYRPAMTQSIVGRVEDTQRGLAFEMQFVAVSLGTAISAALAGFLAEHSFFLVFVLDASTSAVFALIALIFLHDVPRRGNREPAPSVEVVQSTDLGRSPRLGVGLFYLATALFAAVYAQTITALAVHMIRAGLSTGDYGIMLSLNAILVLLIQPVVSPALLRFSGQDILAFGQGAAGLAIAATAFCTTMPAVTASVIAWSIAEIAVGARGTTIAAELGKRSRRPGRVVGRYNSAYAAGVLIGGSAGSALASGGHENIVWGACALFAVAGTIAQRMSKSLIEERSSHPAAADLSVHP